MLDRLKASTVVFIVMDLNYNFLIPSCRGHEKLGLVDLK